MKRLVVMLAACGTSTTPAPDALDCPAPGPQGDPAAVGTVEVGNAELSGLAASRTVSALAYTMGDSGNPATLFTLALDSGAAHGTIAVTGATNVDWEDLAVAPCDADPSASCIYIADTGDNDLARTGVAVYEIPEPPTNPVGELTIAAHAYAIAYPDGAHDVEALFVDPRDRAMYGITKVATDAAAIYRLPRGGTALRLAPALSLGPHVTAADMYADACGARILVRTHAALFELRGAPDATVEDLLASEPVAMVAAAEDQGESVAYRPDGAAYFTVSEGAAPTLWRVDR